MQNVLLGGLITLAVTALVQILVIPWVQRRTRALERWEDNITELVTLVDEKWPEKLSMLQETQKILRAMRRRTRESAEDLGQEGFKADEATRTAYVEAFNETTKMYMVLRRCSLYNSNAPYWAVTFNKLQVMIGRMRDISPDRADVFLSGPDHWELWNKLHMAHDDLSTHLEKVIKPIKPPKPHRIRRLQLIAGMRIARWRGRKERAATEAALAAFVERTKPPAN